MKQIKISSECIAVNQGEVIEDANSIIISCLLIEEYPNIHKNILDKIFSYYGLIRGSDDYSIYFQFDVLNLTTRYKVYIQEDDDLFYDFDELVYEINMDADEMLQLQTEFKNTYMI